MMFKTRGLAKLAIVCLMGVKCMAQPSSGLNNRGIEYPSFRYLQWRYLDDENMTIAMGFGYTEASWDMPGSATIELLNFDGLGLGQTEAKMLGFTQDVWDCYINHYLFYDWDDLDAEIQGYLTAIGWDPSSWGPSAVKPDTYEKFWDELTDDQRGNATELCYFAETWNNDNLIFWTTGPPTDSPTIVPTASPIPTAAPTASPTAGAETEAPETTSPSAGFVVSASLSLIMAAVSALFTSL